MHHSSSDDASIDSELSSCSIGAPSSSLSSSRLRLTPCGGPCGLSASTFFPLASSICGCAFPPLVTAVDGSVEEEGGALKIDCCNSDAVTGFATVGG